VFLLFFVAGLEAACFENLAQEQQETSFEIIVSLYRHEADGTTSNQTKDFISA